MRVCVCVCLQKGNTALHIASLAGQLDAVKLLVQNDAQINSQSEVCLSVWLSATQNTATHMSQNPFPGAQDGQNLISWRWSLPLPTNPVWWRSMHTISSYHGNRPTKPQTHNAHPPTRYRQDRQQYTAPLCLVCRVIRPTGKHCCII